MDITIESCESTDPEYISFVNNLRISKKDKSILLNYIKEYSDWTFDVGVEHGSSIKCTCDINNH